MAETQAEGAGLVGNGSSYSQSRVLVVDDNEQNLELLAACLDPLGCQVATATDGPKRQSQVHLCVANWKSVSLVAP